MSTYREKNEFSAGFLAGTQHNRESAGGTFTLFRAMLRVLDSGVLPSSARSTCRASSQRVQRLSGEDTKTFESEEFEAECKFNKPATESPEALCPRWLGCKGRRILSSAPTSLEMALETATHACSELTFTPDQPQSPARLQRRQARRQDSGEETGSFKRSSKRPASSQCAPAGRASPGSVQQINDDRFISSGPMASGVSACDNVA